ncbi:MAG: hypothetical protein K2X94_04075 [Amoebophilaceae bacterium]|nr:hypothetical protein [Amoebophilaceae bacterium]
MNYSITRLTSEMLLENQLELMEEILTKDNLSIAYHTVVKNKGCAGIDGMQVDDLKGYLQAHWQEIKQQLETGTYRPKPVKQVEIPKSGGRKRKLGTYRLY